MDQEGSWQLAGSGSLHLEWHSWEGNICKLSLLGPPKRAVESDSSSCRT